MDKIAALVEATLFPEQVAKRLDNAFSGCRRVFHILQDDDVRPSGVYAKVEGDAYYLMHPCYLAKVLNALSEGPLSGVELFAATLESRYKRAVGDLRLLGAEIDVIRDNESKVSKYHLTKYPNTLTMDPKLAFERKQRRYHGALPSAPFR